MSDPNKIFNKAYKLQNEGNHLKAESFYKKLLKMNPELEAMKTILYNLGLTLMSLSKYKEAITCFNKSNSIQYNDENTWSVCLCYLNLKEWEKAMSLYKSRYGDTRSSGTDVKFPKLPIQQIDNAKEAKGKKLLVLNEQGLGDELLFATQLLKLDEIVDKALVQVSKDTIDLINKQYSFNNIELTTFSSISKEDVEEYDMYIGLGSIFSSLYNLGESLTTNEFKYNNSNKVGVCWSGNKNSPSAKARAIDSNTFKKIEKELISFQYGKNQGTELGLDDYIPENCLESWNRMDNIEVLVTVDTLMAHIAGLKGIPTILLTNGKTEWRWKYRDQEDERYSMFYPMVEIVNVKEDLNIIINDII